MEQLFTGAAGNTGNQPSKKTTNQQGGSHTPAEPPDSTLLPQRQRMCVRLKFQPLRALAFLSSAPLLHPQLHSSLPLPALLKKRAP